MTTTMTTVDNILKEVLEPGLKEQLQSDTVTIKRIERSSEGVTNQVGGKYVRFPIRVKRNQGIGARNENEALPVAQTQGYESAELQLKYLYGAIELTGQAFELAESDPQTFVSALDQETDGMREGLAKDVNRQVYGLNRGVLTTATAAGTTTTMVTDNAQYLEIGMMVDVYDNTDTDGSNVLNTANVEITAIAEDTPTDDLYTITFGSAVVATATGDFITRTGSRGKEKTGLQQILNTSGDFDALYNITHDIWTANIDDTSSAISEGRMINMVDRIRRRGGKTTVIFMTLGVRRAYFNLLVQQRRYNDTQEFTGGFRGLAFTTDTGDIPVISDFDCPPGTTWFLNEKEIKLYQAGDWSFINRDGSNWQRKVTSAGTFDVFTAHLHKYCELGTHRRNSHGVLENVTEASL